MNKELEKWINLRVESCKDITKMECLRSAIIDRSHKELKMLDLLKEELKEKDKLEQILNSHKVEPMKVPVLDVVEKRYLKNVLRPFKDDVEFICKWSSGFNGKEYIYIKFKYDQFMLPYFDKDTMYKNMELEKKYTLEELGITYE